MISYHSPVIFKLQLDCGERERVEWERTPFIYNPTTPKIDHRVTNQINNHIDDSDDSDDSFIY
jgi:hypothetical protein